MEVLSGGAVASEGAEGVGVAGIIVGDIDGCGLQFNQCSRRESGAFGIADAVIESLALFALASQEDGGPVVVGKVVPLVEVAFGPGEAVLVEEGADGVSALGERTRVVGVEVPREEVEGSVVAL